MADFNPDDKTSWFFGRMDREESNCILQLERDSGVFVVRESVSINGDYVLCVKEDTKISNYIINRIQSGGRLCFRIGDQEFPSLPALLKFYKIHYLDTTTLIRPAQRQKFAGKHRFVARDPGDLSFEEGEELTLLWKDEEEWWTVRNIRGDHGLVPVKYLEKWDEKRPRGTRSNVIPQSVPILPVVHVKPPRKLPARARVKRQYIPCAYDTKALKLEVGDIVTVTAMNINGQWEGEVNGRRGDFPFVYIQFDDELDADSSAPSPGCH
jgi:proto-oncogene C-crk